MTQSRDIRFERIESDYWLVRDHSDNHAVPLGWVRERLVFEAGRYGQVRADRLCTSLEASRRWFTELAAAAGASAVRRTR